MMQRGTILAQSLPGPSQRALPLSVTKKHSEGLQFGGQSTNRQRVQSQSGNFPGATAPGTGARHFPEPLEERSAPAEPRERKEKFDMKTTEEFYRDFPGLVRASMPLYIKSAGPQEPLGKLEQAEQDAGPETGHRRMPATVDEVGRARPRLPSHQDNEAELRRELDTRLGIL